MEKIVYARVLQKSTSDEIRIGRTFPTDNLNKTADRIMEAYKEKLDWWFKSNEGKTIDDGMESFYMEISIVDASTLQVLKKVWESKNNMGKFI